MAYMFIRHIVQPISIAKIVMKSSTTLGRNKDQRLRILSNFKTEGNEKIDFQLE